MRHVLFAMTILITTFANTTFASSEQRESLESIEKEQIVQVLLEKEEGGDSTKFPSSDCLEQYRHRRNVLIGHAVGSPFLFPVETAGVMFLAAMIDRALNPAAFLPGLAGAAMGFFIGAGIFVTYETVVIVKLARTVSMLSLIKDLRDNSPKSEKRLARFFNKVRRKLNKTEEQLPNKTILASLQAMDQTGQFCNANLVSERRKRKYEKRHKMRDALAYKSDVIKALKN